jgi:hypothetical protein
MRQWIKIAGAFVFALAAGGCDRTAAGRPMTQEAMERTVKSLGSNAEGGQGLVTFVYKGMRLALISDAVHDRMRIVTVAAQVSKMTPAQKTAVLEANFHSALDARYAADGDLLYAAFIHPLSTLTEDQLLSGVEQTANLAASYGDSYSSGELIFRGIEK